MTNSFSSSKKYLTILISSYNTQQKYVEDCINSILTQNTTNFMFAIELIWVNDGSSIQSTQYLEDILNSDVVKSSSLIDSVVYKKFDKNQGISACMNYGVDIAKNELIFRMDSDDIMIPSRLEIQYKYMQDNPDVHMCGANIMSFISDEDVIFEESVSRTLQKRFNISPEIQKHRRFLTPSNHINKITWKWYKNQRPYPSEWIMNHPTLCFRRISVLTVGNYYKELREPYEDLHLQLRILKKFGILINLPEVLVLYRVHENQITHLSRNNLKIRDLRRDMIVYFISD